MNKYILVGFLGLLFSVNAFSKDEPVTIDGKNIKVTDFDKMMLSSEIKNSDLNKGVYIVAGSYSNRFKNAEKKIEEVFKANGIKTSDSLENSSMAIVFTTNLALDLAKADQQAANSLMPTRQQFASMSSQVIGAASGGIGGLVGFAAGALFDTDSKLLIQATSSKNPVLHKGWVATGIISSEKDGDNAHGAKVFYNLEKGKEASDDVVLKMAVDQWIKHFIVFDVATEILPETTNIATTDQVVPVTVPVPSGSMESTSAITQ